LPPPQPETTPRRASSIHRQKLLSGTSANISDPATQAGGLSAGSSVRSTNTAICSRVVGLAGQYRLGPQPETTPRRDSSSMNLQNGLEAGTSVKIGVVQAGGV
jgi:hypothetical protein